MQMISNKHS